MLFNKTRPGISELLPASGPPLGLMENISYTPVKGFFSPQDKIFMYTDGWTEARDIKGQEFGAPRLKEILLRGRSQEIDVLLSELEYEHHKFEGRDKQHDDLTAIILQLP